MRDPTKQFTKNPLIIIVCTFGRPVSNHGARVRMLLYKLGLENDVKVTSPMEIGGLRSEEFLALNPQGKMPLLVEDDGIVVWEADAICRHLLEKHAASADSMSPADLAARTSSELLCRLHDAYIGPIQGCMYKPAPPFGRFGTRRAALQELRAQLAPAESLCTDGGPYLCGSTLSLADATLFPTLVFVVHVRGTLPAHHAPNAACVRV